MLFLLVKEPFSFLDMYMLRTQQLKHVIAVKYLSISKHHFAQDWLEIVYTSWNSKVINFIPIPQNMWLIGQCNLAISN